MAHLAYHLVVHALEARGGWTPAARFASAASSCLAGHLPYARLHAAGTGLQRARVSSGELWRHIHDWMQTDLNPCSQVFDCVTSQADALWAINAYFQSVGLGVRNRIAVVDAGNDDQTASRGHLGLTRTPLANLEDPEPCRLGVLMAMEISVGRACRNGETGRMPTTRTLSALAADLGVASSAAAEAAQVFEHEGCVSVARVAQRLGCHERTLERRLRHEGLTAELLRRAARLIRATDALRSQQSLTTIAMNEGFSDLAHMSRSFKAACGLSPTLLRNMVQGAAGPTRRAPRTASQA